MFSLATGNQTESFHHLKRILLLINITVTNAGMQVSIHSGSSVTAKLHRSKDHITVFDNSHAHAERCGDRRAGTTSRVVIIVQSVLPFKSQQVGCLPSHSLRSLSPLLSTSYDRARTPYSETNFVRLDFSCTLLYRFWLYKFFAFYHYLPL